MEKPKTTVFIGVLRSRKMAVSKFFFFLLCFAFFARSKAQLVINEVSQGTTGSKEYVEFLVIGTPTCVTIPCLDLRGYIIDDNNGTFATGAGTGIANGCIKFTNAALWSCVPAGTIILIYNDADLNPLVPPDDSLLNDGNCRLVLPISNCVLFDKHTTQPSVGTSAYPVGGFTTCGNWSEISMANSDDSFQVLDAAGTLLHAVSWGNNVLSNIIYFAGSSAGDVAVMTNAVDNNPANQANWVRSAVAGNETPGAPNNAANAAWINSMNNSCGAILPLTLSFSTVQTACGCTGSATVTAAGGVGPYTYTWSPGGITTNTIGSLCVGNYTATVSSANGCLVSDTVSITSSTVLSGIITTTNVSCNAASDGSANVVPSGSAGPFTYSWSPAGGNAATATNLPAGNYTVTFSDGACSGTATTTITQPAILTASITSVNATCFGANNGSATASGGGGTGAYTYTWSPSGGNNSSATNLSPGNYSVTITDANGCTTSASTLITEPAQVTLTVSTTSVSCNGGANATASVNASGGTGAYTYTWSPIGGNASSATNLPAGNYSVNIADANGCPAVSTFTITQPNAITVTVTSTNASCAQSNGSATVTAIGGTGAYTYSWSPTGGNANTAGNLGAGNYTVTIKDVNNCAASGTVSVLQPPSFSLSITSTSVTCDGGNDGSATVNVNGGTGPFTYNWAPSGGTNAATGTILTQGNYTVSVTDAGGCNGTATVAITQPVPITVSASGQTVCNGQAATLTASAAGGNSPYTYTWSTGANGSSINVNTTVNATYSVVATDNKGCVSAPDTAMVNVLAPLNVVVTSNDTICPGMPAALSAAASGGNGNYTITWLPSNTIGNSINVSPNTSTTYTAVVTDGCTTTPASSTGVVTVLPIPVINFNALPASGCATICVTFAGVATSVPGNNVTTYNWNFGDGTTTTGLNASHCYAVNGSYNVTLSGVTQMGCKDSTVKNNLITVFPKPTADFNASTYQTDEYDNVIQFYDASQSNIVNWQWAFGTGASSGMQNPSYGFSPAGTYPVTLIVTNNFGCMDTVVKTITVKPAFTFYAPNAFTPDDDNVNELFLPQGTGWDLNNYNLWVFDRWGNQLYHTTSAAAGWDGKKHGEALQEDVYAWKVELNDILGAPHQFAGTVSIVR